MLQFYVGLHHPACAQHFERSFISINAIRSRKGAFPARKWILDSGAFTEISTHAGYRHDVKAYARDARRWYGNGELELIVAQDWMCEPFIVAKTGLSVAEHQRLTIERYDALLDEDLPVPVMPVLQGFDPDDYRRHLEAYGDRLTPGLRVGVGSVCKRNGSPKEIVAVLDAIYADRRDLRLHGFGIKKTSLYIPEVRNRFFSADSMAWSFWARKNGRSQHDWRVAEEYRQGVEAILNGQPQKRRGLGKKTLALLETA